MSPGDTMLGGLDRNRRGSIEGLPLQLMIVIMVATIGSAVIMGWMGNIDAPHYIRGLGIQENVVSIEDGTIQDIHVCVTDENGEPLQGVSILISNKQVKGPVMYVMTGADGRATLSGWTLQDYPKTSIRLSVVAYHSGYTDKTEYVEGLIR